MTDHVLVGSLNYILHHFKDFMCSWPTPIPP